MAAVHSDDEILRLVVDWFARQQSNRIPQSLKEPLQNYLARLPATERKTVVPNASGTKRKRTDASDQQRESQNHQRDELSVFEQKAREYLRERHASRGENHSLEKQTRMLRTLNAFNNKNVPEIPSEGFWNSFSSDRSRSQLAITFAASEVNDSQIAPNSSPDDTHLPLQRLHRLRNNVKSSTQLHIMASRILATLIHFHHKQIKAIGIDRDAREATLLRLTGISSEEFATISKEAQGWLRVVGIFGIGVLAVAGSDADTGLDQATLSFLGDCHGFFKNKHPAVLTKISDLNSSVGALFFQVDEGRTEAGCTLLDGSEVLAKALREAFTQPKEVPLPNRSGYNAASRLDALATVAAADQISPLDQAATSSVNDGAQGCDRPNMHSQLLSNAPAAGQQGTTIGTTSMRPLHIATNPSNGILPVVNQPLSVRDLSGRADSGLAIYDPDPVAVGESNRSGWWEGVNEFPDIGDWDEWIPTVFNNL